MPSSAHRMQVLSHNTCTEMNNSEIKYSTVHPPHPQPSFFSQCPPHAHPLLTNLTKLVKPTLFVNKLNVQCMPSHMACTQANSLFTLCLLFFFSIITKKLHFSFSPLNLFGSVGIIQTELKGFKPRPPARRLGTTAMAAGGRRLVVVVQHAAWINRAG